MESEECGYGLACHAIDVPEEGNKNKEFSKAERIGIIINNVKVTGNYINTIHDLIQGGKLLRYWYKQGRFQLVQMEILIGMW